MIYLDGVKIRATIWGVTPATNGKYIDLKMSTGEQNQDGTWTNSKWFPRAIGHAANSLKDAKPGDRIVITKAKISNPCFEQEDGTFKTYLRFLILEAQHADNNGTSNNAQVPKVSPNVSRPEPEEEDEDTPW